MSQLGASIPQTDNATINIDVAMIVRLLDRAIIEVVRSQSAPISGVRVADASRLESYLKEMESFVTWASRQPESDTPKSAPMVIKLDTPLALPAIENDAMWRVAQLLDTARFEVANSQSGGMPNGIKSQDKDRWMSYFADVRRFMGEHVAIVNPVDLPESSPRDPIQGLGRLGLSSD